MNMECLHDCGPSGVGIALLLVGALGAFVAARWSRWSLLGTVPLLVVGLGYAGRDTAFGDVGLGLTIAVLGIPVLGLIRRGRSRRRDQDAPA